MTTDYLSADEATKYLVEAAFHVTDPESSDFGRMLVHCYAGSFGADWDLDAALAVVEKAHEITWVNHWCGHDLQVFAEDGRIHHFDVKRPADSQCGGAL